MGEHLAWLDHWMAENKTKNWILANYFRSWKKFGKKCNEFFHYLLTIVWFSGECLLALKLRLFLSPENLIRNFYSVTDIFRMEQSSLSMRTALQFSCVFANFVCIQSSVRRNVSRCSVLRIYCKVSIIDLICGMIFFENMISALYGEATLGGVKKYFLTFVTLL